MESPVPSGLDGSSCLRSNRDTLATVSGELELKLWTITKEPVGTLHLLLMSPRQATRGLGRLRT